MRRGIVEAVIHLHRRGGARPMRRRRLAAAAACGLALLGGCARGGQAWTSRIGADNPLAGRILDVATGKPIGEDALLARLGQKDFVLVGETAGNPDQARLAARLVTALAGHGRRLTAVVLESLPVDAQPLIVEYLRAHPGDARGLDRVLKAAAPDRPDLGQFTPAVAASVAANAQLVAGDLSAETLRAVLTHGYKALQPELVQRTGLAEPFATPVEQGLKDELAAAACERASSHGLDALVRARRARDATMADRLAAVAGRGQGVLLASPSHVRIDRGVPWYLRQLRPAAGIASLAFVELPDAATRPAGLPYDYVWLTPATAAGGPDPCTSLPARPRQPPPAPEPGETALLGRDGVRASGG